MQLASDADEHLIEMPLIARARSPATQAAREALAELLAPAADGLVGHKHAALGQDQLDVTQAQAEHMVQPDSMRNDLGRKAMAVVWIRRLPHPATLVHLVPARQPPLT
jgi:hypothetical protein